MAKLDMGNMSDDQIEKFLVFARSVAELNLYGSELPYQEHYGDDAMEALNSCIEEARSLTGINPDYEGRARAAGWIAEAEYNGESDGVRNPKTGDWAETWHNACEQIEDCTL